MCGKRRNTTRGHEEAQAGAARHTPASTKSAQTASQKLQSCLSVARNINVTKGCSSHLMSSHYVVVNRQSTYGTRLWVPPWSWPTNWSDTYTAGSQGRHWDPPLCGLRTHGAPSLGPSGQRQAQATQQFADLQRKSQHYRCHACRYKKEQCLCRY